MFVYFVSYSQFQHAARNKFNNKLRNAQMFLHLTTSYLLRNRAKSLA